MATGYEMYITGAGQALTSYQIVAAAEKDARERFMRESLQAIRANFPRARLVILPIKA